MYWMLEILTNFYFLSFFVSWLTACIVKAATKSHSKGQRFTIKYGFENGGMPSTHTAAVTAILVSIGLIQHMRLGYFNETFYFALVFTLIIISDAFGVRQYVGKQGEKLNKILKLKKMDTLKVVYGHTFLQVLGGLIWGTIIPFVLYLILF
ncbi:divergent PAP2 family protein [Candidatus Woesearchaeota archaeon]|nr:divergent PAP2 family protein [Candidatus Woesearchaeota archaeon]MCF7901115.1 divergent PAP2 family protein [Candidatus Woesearchaeota archaeon]MCF8012896.1 divergent PAP2 family protein [Candidatus Woesearchaeota archaeon]